MRQLYKLLFCAAILVGGVASAFAQQRTVSGKVTDDQNLSMPGVSVTVKGTTAGTTTDIDGNYSLNIPTDDAVLEFSFIGYATREVVVGTRTQIDIALSEDAQSLDEVVVVAYGVARKGDVTGALTNVKPSDSDLALNSVNSLLEGKVAGLVVNSSSSAVGSASSVTIRGANSLRGDNQPLYVIDNIPQASTGDFAGSAFGNGDYQIEQDPLSQLNPSDILDITILKDASSTAIYGSRGANGVILITTKKGQEGAARVNVSANFTVAQPSKFLDMLNLRQFAEYSNSKVTEEQRRYFFAGNAIHYKKDGTDIVYDPNDPESYRVIDYIDWQREVYNTSFSQNYSVSVSGGTQKVQYYVSANFKDVNGTVKNTSWIQGDLRSNLTAQLGNKVKLNLVMGGSLRQNNMMPGGNNVGGATGGVSSAALMYIPYAVTPEEAGSNETLRTSIYNWLEDYVDKTNARVFNASLNLTWDISKNFHYQLRTGGNLNLSERARWYGPTLFPGYNGTYGKLAHSDINRNNFTVENLLMYNGKIGEIAKIDATVGVTYDDYNSLVKNQVGNDFTFLGLREKGMSKAGKITISDPVQSDYQLLSYLARLNVSLYDKYLITASFRADGSSKFLKGSRWGYFPSASVAWRMEQENFLRDVDWLHQLKIRLSYGVTGNQAIDPYMAISMYGNPNNNVYGNGDGSTSDSFVVTNMANTSLTWETTTSWNVGIDFGFFNSRLSGSLDLYQKTTSDLLLSTKLPGSATVGDGTIWYNRGSLSNKGIEFSLNAQIIDTKDWKWSVGGNIGANKGIIKSLGMTPSDFSGTLKNRAGYLGDALVNNLGAAPNIFLEGEAPGLFFGYRTQGIVQKDDIVNIDGVNKIRYTKADGSDGYYEVNPNYSAQAGDLKYYDADGNGIIDANDRTIIGNPNPDFTYGFSTNISYRRLSLSIAFNGVKGVDRLNYNLRSIGLPKQDLNSNILQSAYEGIWTEENHSNRNPRANYTVGNYLLDRYIEDASYLRCSDITLSYSLPQRWMKKIGFRNCAFSFSVKNAFVVTKYSGYDPEVNSFAFRGTLPGIDMSSYPSARSYILGINLNF